MITIDKITEITRLFYDEHLRPTDIAKQIGVGKSYVTKIIQKDERYIEEKNTELFKARKDTKFVKEITLIKNGKLINKNIKQC